jgi:DNA-directed RNA polymerase subunit D
MVEFTSKGHQGYFVFKDEHPTVVNAIRRLILDEVPTFAIEDVEFVLNESPLYEEALAHRLGLIPLKTDLKSYNKKSECKCGGIGCALCEVKITISADTQGYVLSGLLQSDDPQVVPVDKNIPITKLLAGKKLQANMKAVLGTGREHAKWAPAHAFLKEEKGAIVLVVEPFGQLDTTELYNAAIDIAIAKIEELEAKV